MQKLGVRADGPTEKSGLRMSDHLPKLQAARTPTKFQL